jgi:hypothetical protein
MKRLARWGGVAEYTTIRRACRMGVSFFTFSAFY